MSTKWYNSDWFLVIMAIVTMTMTIVGNYYYHGGRLVW